MLTPYLKVDSLSKSFVSHRSLGGRSTLKVRAVDDVSFSLDAGKTLAVVGESGSGKSTLGRLVLRLIEADSGSVLIDGCDIRSLSSRELRSFRSRIEMIFQDPYSSMDPKMTIADSVAEPLVLHRQLSRQARLAEVKELFAHVGLRTEQMDRFPYELSGGQLQRAAIARAIATDRKLIICDEPVASLDISIRGQVLNLLRRLQDELRISYIFITHDLSIARNIADDIAVMYQGRFVEVGPVGEIFDHPRHPYTQRLLAAVLEADPSQHKLASIVSPVIRDDHDGTWNGCAYYNRCPIAIEHCKAVTPLLEQKGSGVAVACHLAEASVVGPLERASDLGA